MRHDTSRFQARSYAFDNIVAVVLELSSEDTPAVTALLFGGQPSADEILAAFGMGRAAVSTTFERIRLGFCPLDGCSTNRLAVLASSLQQAGGWQELGTANPRRWLLSVPSSPARCPHVRGGLSPTALQRVQEFIEANLGESIRLHDLATCAALSSYHFARAFKTSVGMTPRRFVEGCRVERARRLLAESMQPIATVAVDAGFSTQSRLTAVFKRHTGLTPAAYRRDHAPTVRLAARFQGQLNRWR